jgi:hypothetical protein
MDVNRSGFRWRRIRTGLAEEVERRRRDDLVQERRNEQAANDNDRQRLHG